MSLSALINSNREVLLAAKQIIADLTDDQYRYPPTSLFGSSVGAHMRHICDHYGCFFTGVETGQLDYDERKRCPNVETDRAVAMAQIDDCIEQLQKVKAGEAAIAVTLRTSTRTDESAVTSSISRELVFLHGHATHHFALISIMLKQMDLPVDARLGLAPSTFEYQRQVTG